MIRAVLRVGRGKVLLGIAVIVTLIAAADWRIGNRASLGVLYLLPMILGGIVLPIPTIVGLALACAALRSIFDIPSPQIEILLRFIFATFAYSCAGLLVKWLIRNRELEEHLRILVESSPAAILTVGSDGRIIAANKATSNLFVPPDGEAIEGRSIGDYLPVLADALQFDPGPGGLSTSAQCQGRRDNGEIFLANTWFSSYEAPEGRRLAAIVADASEEMRDREEQSLRQLMSANRIAAAGVSHEIRNLCGAIAVISVNLKEKKGLEHDEDLHALTSLVRGLEKVAAVELQSRSDSIEDVELRAVLDDLRIVIEPDWREIGGEVHWKGLSELPRVLADRHGLLQAFLNLAHNSLRAVQESPVKKLWIIVSKDDQKTYVRFVDSGTGIAAPERLFAPFQPGADGTGLGLYVSRALVRSCGGDIRFEPRDEGSCFCVELQIVP